MGLMSRVSRRELHDLGIVIQDSRGDPARSIATSRKSAPIRKLHPAVVIEKSTYNTRSKSQRSTVSRPRRRPRIIPATPEPSTESTPRSPRGYDRSCVEEYLKKLEEDNSGHSPVRMSRPRAISLPGGSLSNQTGLDYKSLPPTPPSEQIEFLQRKVSALTQQLELRDLDLDRLVVQAAEAESQNFNHTNVKDDDYLAKMSHHLYILIRNFVREFIRPAKKMYPSSIPEKVVKFLDEHYKEWREHRKGTQPEKFLRAAAQKYISFFLTGTLFVPALPLDDHNLSDAVDTLLKRLNQNPKLAAQWRVSTFNTLLSCGSFKRELLIQRISDELVKNTRGLWKASPKATLDNRIRKIVEPALDLAFELRKLSHEVKCVFKLDDDEYMSRCIDGEPEIDLYGSRYHSRNWKLQGTVVFPGIYKATTTMECNTGQNEIAAEYIPIQYMSY